MKKLTVVLMGLVLLMGLAFVSVSSAQTAPDPTKSVTPTTDCASGKFDFMGRCVGAFPEPANKPITPAADCPGGKFDFMGRCEGKFPEPANKQITPTTDCPQGKYDFRGRCTG
jgi:hypothetical protein